MKINKEPLQTKSKVVCFHSIKTPKKLIGLYDIEVVKPYMI